MTDESFTGYTPAQLLRVKAAYDLEFQKAKRREHIRICAKKVDEITRRKAPWHQREETWRPLAEALKKEGLMR